MKRVATLVALMATACTTMEPANVPPDPAIPASWPVNDPALVHAEASLPAVTYPQMFSDRRLQTLIAQALVNNRDLMIAAANIDAAREQYRIRRANQLPTVNANAGATVSKNSDDKLGLDYQLGASVPSFELDLFGRLRSLTHAELERYLATEAGARSTRLSLVAQIADAWLNYAADVSLLAISRETVTSAEKSVRLTRARLEGGIAPRTDLRQAEQVLTQAQSDVAQQTTYVAQDVNALQLLVGGPVSAGLLPASIDEAAPTIGRPPAGVDSYVLLRRPDVVQAEYTLRAASAEIGAARAALFPRISLTGLLGFASTALGGLFTGEAFGGSLATNAAYTIFNGGASRANVRLTEAQRNAALASYQRTLQTAFREVADALARDATMGTQLDALQRRKEAAADNYLLNEARYREGIDPYLTTLDAQRSYYIAQQQLVNAKVTAAQNRVALYQSLGGDPLLQSAPLCSVTYVSNANSAKLASQCSPA